VDWIARARQGDSEAVALIVREYEAEIRILARVLLGPALRPILDSVDIVQSVHRSLIVGLKNDKYELSTPDRLIALALTVTRRKVARVWRKSKRQIRSTNTNIDEISGILANLSDGQINPARAVEVREAVRFVLDEASEQDRKLIELRLLGYSTADAARELGQDADVLRVRLSRLRAKLCQMGAADYWL
jgi:RNA polymerase sigma-70 factor (ECF subfamily)